MRRLISLTSAGRNRLDRMEYRYEKYNQFPTFRLGQQSQVHPQAPLGVQLRIEAFNNFNHTQFFGPAAAQGNIDNSLFGYVVKAASPRLLQAALKFTF